MKKKKLKEYGYIYLSSPYSDEYSFVKHHRYVAVCKIAGYLLGEGYVVHCPIAESHAIAELSSEARTLTHDQWMLKDIEQLKRSDALFVAMIEGWKRSKGVTEEIEFAKANDIPIKYVDMKGKIHDDER